VIGLRLIELQRAGEGIQDLDGHAGEVSALHPRVVLDADPGEHGHLFAAQAGHPATPAADDSRPVRGDPVPARMQELSHLRSMIHTASGNVGAPLVGGTASTPKGSHSQPRNWHGGMVAWLPSPAISELSHETTPRYTDVLLGIVLVSREPGPARTTAGASGKSVACQVKCSRRRGRRRRRESNSSIAPVRSARRPRCSRAGCGMSRRSSGTPSAGGSPRWTGSGTAARRCPGCSRPG
jgi:hypothetical protein